MYIKQLEDLNAEVIVRYYPPRRYSVRIKKIESDQGTWAVYVYDNKDRQCSFVVWIRKREWSCGLGSCGLGKKDKTE